MSNATVRSVGLQRTLARRTFVVFVALESDMSVLRKGASKGWTVPSSARPGDLVVVYKPAESAGWAAGKRKPPYEAFVAAGVVYAKPKRLYPKVFNAPLGEVQVFPRPVARRQVADAFPEWKWLRHMRGSMGAEVPPTIEGDLLRLIDRLAYSAPAGRRR